MTGGGQLPNSWADVACSLSEQGLPAPGMIKPTTLALVLSWSMQAPELEPSLYREVFSTRQEEGVEPLGHEDHAQKESPSPSHG